MVSLEEFEHANLQAQRSHGPTAVAARYDRRIHRVVARLNTGLEIAFSPGWAQGLEHAHWQQLTPIEISPSGLSLPDSPNWMQTSISPRCWKAYSARSPGWRRNSAHKAGGRGVRSRHRPAGENGKRGGRPKTQVA